MFFDRWVPFKKNPKNIQEDLAEAIRDLDSSLDNLFDKTSALTEADFAIIGKAIQIYSYMDFNARRIVEAIQDARGIAPKVETSHLNDAEAFKVFGELIKLLPDSNSKDGLLKAFDIFNMHHPLRHTFAHWSARKLKKIDALILFTKNAKEVKRRGVDAHAKENATYCIIPLAPFRLELRKLIEHCNYIAAQALYIEQHKDYLKIF